jgi:hypothetical protein
MLGDAPVCSESAEIGKQRKGRVSIAPQRQKKKRISSDNSNCNFSNVIGTGGDTQHNHTTNDDSYTS